MLHQPTSPNVFNQIYLSSHKQEKQDNFSQSQLIFNKKLQTIEQFMDLLQDNPQNLAQITSVELRWQRNFYKHELKAALSLNYFLIKVYYEQNDQLNVFKSHMQSLTSKKKQQFQNKLQGNYQNIQEHSNGATPIKKKVMRDAFEAQKKIIHAKYKLQCDQLKKTLQHRQCVLKAAKQQNQYLRSQLIKMGEKHKILSKLNKDLEEKRRKNEEENKRMNMVIRQLQQNEKKWIQQKRLNQLNCSPIHRSGQTFTIQQGQVSFNHQFYQQHIQQNKLLKKQLDDLKISLEKVKKQNLAFTSKNQIDHYQQQQHQEVMKQSRRMFLTSLQAQYIQLKQQLQIRVSEIEKYKINIQQIKEKYQKYMQGQTKKECSKCIDLTKVNDILKVQNQQIQSKYCELKQKLQKTLSLQVVQRKKWEAFLNDLTE